MLSVPTATKVEKLAQILMWGRHRIATAERPIDRKTAEAEHKGMTKAAHALGFGSTPTHIEMLSLEVWRLCPAPHFPLTGNGRQRTEWEGAVIRALAAKLIECRVVR